MTEWPTQPAADAAEVVVVGSFMMDLIAYAARRPAPGETLVGDDFTQTPGGKGFNQAIASARAGVRTAMIGKVGQDSFGDEFLAELAGAGVDTDGVLRDDRVGTGVGLPVVSADGQNSIIVIPRANRQVSADEAARLTAAATDSNSILLLQLELPIEAVLAAARAAKQAGATVMLNPAPFAAISDELLALVDIVVPNEVELDHWCGLDESSASTTADRLQRAQQLADQLGLVLVLTLGAEGSAIIERGRAPRQISGHRVEVVDTIGAGDTFCGQLAAHLVGGRSLDEAATWANAAAALAVTRRGGAASVPTLAQVRDLLATDPTRTTERTPS